MITMSSALGESWASEFRLWALGGALSELGLAGCQLLPETCRTVPYNRLKAPNPEQKTKMNRPLKGPVPRLHHVGTSRTYETRSGRGTSTKPCRRASHGAIALNREPQTLNPQETKPTPQTPNRNFDSKTALFANAGSGLQQDDRVGCWAKPAHVSRILSEVCYSHPYVLQYAVVLYIRL